jgi:Cytochrome C oxidase subunit II, transmembrane domain/LAGLIDADG endonuclease/Cytochrome C oxidase subunit II, periplasmic domain
MLNILNSIYRELLSHFIIHNDAPEPWGIGFQDGVSPGFSGIEDLHDNIFFYLVVIAILVFWMLGSTIYYFNSDKSKISYKYLVHGTLIEAIWTMFPAVVLLAIAIPSFRLLYILDEVTLPTITIKATGHQWYWSYEYSDYETESGDPIEYDSYMLPADWSRKSIPWAELPNSEDTLKIVVPSHSWKAMSGWSNYSGKVTSCDILEKEMGYCGSKSSAFALVKEQRVDGSYSFPIKLLRYTLMAPVMGYQPEILSNQSNVSENVILTKRPKLKKLDPWFLTGFVDAEGYFSIELFKDSKAKFKYTPKLVFGINLHVKDLPILLSFKDTLGVGTVSTKEKVTTYKVKTFKDLAVIVNHFKLYPLVSSKYIVYQYWLQAYNVMATKEHFNSQGMTKLATLKNLTNFGLSESLKEAFPDLNISLIDTISSSFRGIPHGMWVAGFTSGDGSFYTKMTQYKESFHTGCIFKITLHLKDTALLEGLYDFFSNYFPNISFNKYTSRTNKGIGFSKQTVSLTISNIRDIHNIIIPLFDIYPVLGVKHLDYNDFKKISNIILSKDHLSPEGLAQIKKIRNNMNDKRTVF